MNRLARLISDSRVLVAFAAVYLIWGSTYLGIRIAIESIPPFILAASRFLIAGAVLFFLVRRKNTERISRLHWRSAVIIGGLLVLGGNGGVTFAEQWVPSGWAALIVSTVPLWMVLLDWLRGSRTRPTISVALGLFFGLTGIALLVAPGGLGGPSAASLLGFAVLLVAALSWSTGSLYSRGATLPASPLLATAMEMLMGGGLLLGAAVATGEVSQFRWDLVSLRSLVALSYLTIFGSLVAFTCYVWLLKATSPARASTYAFVNPIVAVLLGAVFAGEPLTPECSWLRW